MDTPGVEIVRPLTVFNNVDAPHGHMRVKLNNVRVPKDCMILGAGRGFEFHRAAWVQAVSITVCVQLVRRKKPWICSVSATTRTAFGRPLSKLGGNIDIIADARMNIEQARLLT